MPALDFFAKLSDVPFPRRFVYGPVVAGAHSTFLQFALEKLRSGEPFDAFADQSFGA